MNCWRHSKNDLQHPNTVQYLLLMSQCIVTQITNSRHDIHAYNKNTYNYKMYAYTQRLEHMLQSNGSSIWRDMFETFEMLLNAKKRSQVHM